VQQLLGHRDLNTTEIDIHLELLDLQQASAPPEEVVPFEFAIPFELAQAEDSLNLERCGIFITEAVNSASIPFTVASSVRFAQPQGVRLYCQVGRQKCPDLKGQVWVTVEKRGEVSSKAVSSSQLDQSP
jgi:hypothetical protein